MYVWRFSEQNRISFSIAMKFINDRGLEDIGVYMITWFAAIYLGFMDLSLLSIYFINV